MKAHIEPTGVLVLQPESPTEAYALSHWKRQSFVQETEVSAMTMTRAAYYKAISIHITKIPGEE